MPLSNPFRSSEKKSETESHRHWFGAKKKTQLSTAESSAREAREAPIRAAEKVEDSLRVLPIVDLAGPEANGKDPVNEVRGDGELSQELWNRAFDEILDNEKDLTKAYIQALKIYMGDGKPEDETATEDADILVQLHDRQKRQAFMKEVVEKGVVRIETTRKVSQVIGSIAETILSAKPVVDIVTTIPQAAPAAIPWAGACVGLQLLSNPKRAINSNLAGIAQVSSRMDTYCGLVGHLIGTANNPPVDMSFESVIENLGKKVMNLYKTILVYQMKSTCSYYRNQIYNFVLQLWDSDDWDGALRDVEGAKDDLMGEWDTYDRARASRVRDQLVDITDRMEKHLGSINQTLEAYFQQQQKTRMDKDSEDCLSALCVVNTLDDIERIEKEKEPLIEDAYSWILADPKYGALTNWGDPTSAECNLLWIKGEAGTGKTMLLIGIIRELSNQLAELTPSLACFFFQSRGKSTQPLNSAAAGLKCLMWMLLTQQPELMSYVLPDFKKAKDSHFNDQNTTEAMVRHFKAVLKEAKPIYFILDAFDECDFDPEEVIEVIARSLCLSDKVKWLVTSRPEVDLLARINAKREELQLNSKISRPLFELNIRDRRDRLQKYIQQKWTARKTWKFGNTFDKTIIENISLAVSQRAEDNLLWVSLVFKDLPKMRGIYAEANVKEYPSGLRKLYDHKMNMIENREEEGEDEPKRLACCKDVLIVASHAYRPLSLSELGSLIPWSDKTDPAVIIDDCASFLTLTDEVVTLNHKSAKDYLMDNPSRLQDGNVKSNENIGRLSLKLMSSELKQNMYGLKDYGFISNPLKAPEESTLGQMAYSCESWVYHLCDVKDGVPRKLGLGTEDVHVLEFLEKNFLHWLEGLSLLGNISAGLDSIRLLLRAIQAERSTPLVAFLKDAQRFIMSHGSIIAKAPLQIYGTALMFDPTKSKIRSLFWRERLPFIKDIRGIEDHPRSLRQTLRVKNGVKCLAFSPDSTKLASASGLEEIHFWDVGTGSCNWKVKCNDGESVRGYGLGFSPHGKTLASSLGRLELWGTATGNAKKTFDLSDHKHRGHSGLPIKFSADGKTIVSAARNGEVRLWNIATGSSEHIFDGCGTETAFSSDGTLLASLPQFERHSDTIYLWYTETGKRKHVLEGHKGEISHLTFSMHLNSNTLASASHDGTVRIWDTDKGTTKHIIQDHPWEYPLMALSPDGNTIALTTLSDIWLWNYTSGVHIQTFKGRKSRIDSIAYSPDGSVLASGDSDGYIKLWDCSAIIDGENSETPDIFPYEGDFNSIIFSPDGSKIASMSNNKIRLWDSTTAECLHFLENGARLQHVAFSKDGNTLVSISWTMPHLQFWDTSAGTVRPITGGEDVVTKSIVFSQDGTMMAYSGYRGGLIHVWNIDTLSHHQFSIGEDIQANFYSDVHVRIAFSPDSTKLASFEDKLMRVLDFNKGTTLRSFKVEDASCFALAVSPRGEIVAYAAGGPKIGIWQTSTDIFEEHRSDTIGSMKFSANGTMLALYRTWSNSVQVWNTTTSSIEHTAVVPKLYEYSVSDDGSMLYSNRGVLTFSDETSCPSVFVQDEWIVCGSKRLIWLPVEYREYDVAVFNSVAALWNKSDNLLVMSFDVARVGEMV